MSYAARLRTVQVSEQGFETAERHSYYDDEPVRQVFGSDSHEKMLDDTQGLGYTREDSDGTLLHRDRKSGDWVAVTEREFDQVYLGGDTEHEAD